MREIVIKTIPHKEQRYDTVGDYWIDDNNILQMRISKMNDKYEFLVAIHELIEAFLTQQRGVSNQAIDDFDMQYEKDRQAGRHPEDTEPGNDKNAPYYKEHQFATGIERVLANELDVDWTEYDEEIINL